MSTLRAGLAAAALLALAACGPTNYLVLLDDPDVHESAVTLTTAGGTRTVDRPGFGTDFDNPDRAPPEVFSVAATAIEDDFGKAIAAQPPRPKRFVLYFLSDGTVLTDASRRLLPEIVTTYRGWTVPRVAVVGHTDRVGAADYNATLSLDRARAVQALLVKEGVPAELIEVDSHGEYNPLIRTRDEVGEPRNRRVEVTVR